MNMPLRKLVLLMVALPALAAAQKGGGARSAPGAHPPGWADALPRGKSFSSQGERYTVLGGARAVPRAPHQSEAQALAPTRASPADVVDRLGPFLVVRVSDATPRLASGTDGQPVVVNARTGKVAIVPGTLTVRLRKGSSAAAVARAHRLALVSAAPRLRAAFVRVGSGTDVASAAAALARDPGVEAADVDVVEHRAVPH